MATLSFVLRPRGVRSTAVRLLACLLSTAVILPAGASDGGSAEAGPRRIAVLAADGADLRLASVEEAVWFWNDAVSSLGGARPFAAPKLVTPPSGLRPFKNFAHQLSQLGGRLHASAPGPAPPEALLALDAEVVVLLTAQNLMPFAWPFDEDGRHFVAIAAGDADGDAERDDLREHLVRNVIAHELGHVLGLEHSSEPGVLMCLPCDTSADPGLRRTRFRPLTEADLERLRAAAPGIRR